MFDFVSILLHFFLDFIRNTIKKLLDKFGVEGRQAGDKNVVYIDESEVPEDIRNALKAAYVAYVIFLLYPKSQQNGYKVTTNFSESDYSCYEEYARINAMELRISRKKVAA